MCANIVQNVDNVLADNVIMSYDSLLRVNSGGLQCLKESKVRHSLAFSLKQVYQCIGCITTMLQHMQWPTTLSYHIPLMPNKHLWWPRIYFCMEAFWKHRYRSGLALGAALASAANQVKYTYCQLFYMQLGGIAHIQPDSGPSHLHPIAIYQYWSFFCWTWSAFEIAIGHKYAFKKQIWVPYII